MRIIGSGGEYSAGAVGRFSGRSMHLIVLETASEPALAQYHATAALWHADCAAPLTFALGD
jgi:hypothetical protein